MLNVEKKKKGIKSEKGINLHSFKHYNLLTLKHLAYLTKVLEHSLFLCNVKHYEYSKVLHLIIYIYIESD